MTQARKWMAVTALIVLASLALGWVFLVSPKRASAADLRAQKQVQVDANTQLRTKIAQLKAQADDIPAQRARIEAIRAKIPVTPEMPTLIRNLATAARKSGVKLQTLVPAEPTFAATTPVVAKAPKPAATGAAGAASTPAPGAVSLTPAAGSSGIRLAIIPVTMTAAGDYFAVEEFLNSLEKLKRSFLVTGIDVNTVKSSGTVGTDPEAATAAAGASVASGDVTIIISGRVFMTSGAAASTPAAPVAPAVTK